MGSMIFIILFHLLKNLTSYPAAHPKVKVFITQGGLQSFQEAVHYGVPLVGIPWSGDQECNVAKMVDAGIGVLLKSQDLHSYEKIKVALEAVLFDER